MAEKAIPEQIVCQMLIVNPLGWELWTTRQTEGCAAFVGPCPNRGK